MPAVGSGLHPPQLLRSTMNFYVCIDDTDMPGTRGTGWLVQELCEHIEDNHLGTCLPISRHQLFVHEDVPFTSHNSAMCFELHLEGKDITQVIDFAGDFLEHRAEQGADPGLCVAAHDACLDKSALIAFGRSAKGQIMHKEQAYNLAHASGVHLSEHGGTGDGIIGALAGVGLRMAGDDGRYRGWYHLGLPGESLTVGELCSYPFVDVVTTTDGACLHEQAVITIGSEKIKTIRSNNSQVIMVTPLENDDQGTARYRTITHREAKQY